MPAAGAGRNWVPLPFRPPGIPPPRAGSWEIMGENTRVDGKMRAFGKRELALNGAALTFFGGDYNTGLIAWRSPGFSYNAQSTWVLLYFSVNVVKKHSRDSWLDRGRTQYNSAHLALCAHLGRKRMRDRQGKI